MSGANIVNCLSSEFTELFEELKPDIEEFVSSYAPLESKSLYVLMDNRTNAVFCECHIQAKKLLSASTTKVPLDPDEQPEYPANRALVDDSDSAFSQMIEHAKERRGFSNIVCEYTKDFDPEHPLKIVGGQHRYRAIELAFERDINESHGLKVYFGLDPEQRMDVQLISNTNIDISPDLLDRVFETYSGPELRDWCHLVGLLEASKDFADKRQQGPPINVRTARTFIMNFYAGLQIPSNKFDDLETLPIIARTGVSDPDWEKLKSEYPDVWKNKALQEAAKEFAELAQAQKLAFDRKKKKDRKDVGYSEVAYNYSVVSSWAFVAGVLQSNKTRLERHYSLKNQKSRDPLNAAALAEGRHSSDPEKYRGIATRVGPKERGRMAELFFAQAEKGDGINKSLVDIAISRYHAKKANLEVREKEARYSE